MCDYRAESASYMAYGTCLRRTLLAAALLGGCGRPHAETVAALPCPPADSLYTATNHAPGRDLYVHGRFARYVTYVIDSLYVFRNQPTTADDNVGPLGSLATADIRSLEVLKNAAGERWSGCPGVPAILINTETRRWRPPVTPGESRGAGVAWSIGGDPPTQLARIGKAVPSATEESFIPSRNGIGTSER